MDRPREERCPNGCCYHVREDPACKAPAWWERKKIHECCRCGSRASSVANALGIFR